MGERRCLVARPRRARDHEGQRRPPAPRAASPTAPPSPTWVENGSVRAATRLPGKAFGAPRAIASSSTLAVPDAAVAVGTRGLVLLHAQQGTGATLVAAAVTGSLGRRARAGGRDDGADHRGRSRAARRRQRARRLRRRAVADDDLERCSRRRRRLGTRRRRGAAAGGHARPATAPLAASRRQRRPDVPRPGAGCRRRAASLRRGALGGRRAGERSYRSTRAPSWPAPTSGSRSMRAGNAYAAWSVSDGRVRTSVLPVGRRVQRRADDRGDRAHSARRGGAGRRRRAARLDRRVRAGRAGAAHVRVDAHRLHDAARDAAAGRRDDAREPRARRLHRRLGDRHRDDGHGRRTALRRRRARAVDAAATPWTTQNVRTGLTEPVGSPQLAMGALGAIALWVEGSAVVASGTDHGLPRVLALAKPKKVGIGVLAPLLGARERHLVADHRRRRGATATARASAAPRCGTPTRAPAPSTSR